MVIDVKNSLDSLFVFISQQMCFHSAVKQESNQSDIIGCLQNFVIIYSFMKEIKLYIDTSNIVFSLC